METNELKQFLRQVEYDEERGLLPKGYTDWVRKEVINNEIRS